MTTVGKSPDGLRFGTCRIGDHPNGERLGSCSGCTGFRASDTGLVSRFKRCPDGPDCSIVEIEPVGVAGFEGFHAKYPCGDFGKPLPCGEGQKRLRRSPGWVVTTSFTRCFGGTSRVFCPDRLHRAGRLPVQAGGGLSACADQAPAASPSMNAAARRSMRAAASCWSKAIIGVL